MGVHDEGQVEKALSRRYVRDVRQPDPVGLTGHEVPAKQVRCGSSPRITASSSTLLTPHTALEPGGFHQPCYSPPTATDPKRAKLCVYPRIAVSPRLLLWIWRIFSVRRASCRLLSECGLPRQA